MFKTKWRVVRDGYDGYEVQCKPWFCPFFFQHEINTHSSIENALAYVKRYAKPREVVWESD